MTEKRAPCPHCAEPILPAANVCRFCNRDLHEGWSRGAAPPLLLTTPAPKTPAKATPSPRTPSAGLTIIGIICVFLVVGGVYRMLGVSEPSSSSSTATSEGSKLSEGAKQRIAALRDEALENIGWVAGNAYGRPAWPRVKEYVGEGGTYYKTLTEIVVEGPQAFYSNVEKYKAAEKRGRASRYDDSDMTRRVQRVMQIIDEMTRELQSGR